MVTHWLHKNLPTLNIDKTKYILFTTRNTNIPIFCPNIYADSCKVFADIACNYALANTNDIKYLGITLDTNLNFRKHIDLLWCRVRKLIYLFKNLRNIADYSLMKKVYLSLCQSLVTYCITS